MKDNREMASDSALQLTDVGRAFGSTVVYEGLDLSIARHEFVAIVGPSGCGKTTLLNLLSGFDKPSTGTIERQGQARTVYQQGGLFPWLTAGQNILLGMRHVRNEAEQKRQLAELLELIHLDGFADHYPHQLSGGMKQRVEIARALASDADILLLDEPFSALDYLTRLRMRRELERLMQERARTVVFVTHDVEEAAHLADRVVVLTARPARIQCELHIQAPRPRDITSKEVVDAVRQILEEMGLGYEISTQNEVKSEVEVATL
jgi:ABC-type nitrate/sulfonate/bicarbonate transport system ATPase subunit